MTQKTYAADYLLTLEALLSMMKAQMPAGVESLILLPDQDSAGLAASQTSWSLLLSGVVHLARGGVGGGPGLLTSAITKASLRSAPLAAALEVAPPVFEQRAALVAGFSSGYDEAKHLVSAFFAAVADDIDKSVMLIMSAMQPPVAPRTLEERIRRDLRELNMSEEEKEQRRRDHARFVVPTRGYFNQLALAHHKNCDVAAGLTRALVRPAPPAPSAPSMR